MSINYQSILDASADLTDNIFSDRWPTNTINYTFLNILPSYYYTLDTIFPASWIIFSDIDTGPTLGTEDFDMFRPQQIAATNFILSTSASFNSMTAAYRVSFSDVTNISFSEKIQTEANPNDVGEITLLNVQLEDNPITNPEPLVGQTRLPGDIIADQGAGDVFIDRNVSANQDILLFPAGQAFWTLLHELGHAVGGLDHISGTYDSQKYTVMSYNTNSETFPVRPYTLQILDIAALQEQYGTRNYTTRAADTIYSPGNGLAPLGVNFPFMYTIWDGSGNGLMHQVLI
jgi:hypothetical protein